MEFVYAVIMVMSPSPKAVFLNYPAQMRSKSTLINMNRYAWYGVISLVQRTFTCQNIGNSVPWLDALSADLLNSFAP